MKLGLLDILKVAGFDPNLPTKLVRHQDSRFDMLELRQDGALFDLYQSYQGKPVFDKAKQIISFYGLPGTSAGFYGVYEVLGRTPASEGPVLPVGLTWSQGAQFCYKLERMSRFDYFRDRVVIDWGKGAINWVQWLDIKNDKEVLEILASGRKLPPFTDYLGFSLKHDQLKDLFGNEAAHQDWKTSLSGVSGIYLIVAEKSGNMYVGAAYGVDGIWGRWRNYAKSGHGDNVELEKLMKSDSSYPAAFRFSVLQILPKSTTANKAIEWEKLYKLKLGTRATGLNLN